MSEIETIDVCARTYAKDKTGPLVDAWTSLPKTDEEIAKFLHDETLIGRTEEPDDKLHKEFSIFINETPYPFGGYLGKPEDIYGLNLLAKQMLLMSAEQLNEAQAYCCSINEPMSVDEILNICVQTDDIRFFNYNFEGLESLGDRIYPTPEQKYGRQCAYGCGEKTEWYQALEKAGLVDCFDFKRYGAKEGQYMALFDDGFLDTLNSDVDLEYYSREELKDMIDEKWEAHQVVRKNENTQQISDMANDAKFAAGEQSETKKQDEVEIGR